MMQGISNLEEISLRWNPIQTIAGFAFAGQSYLSTFYICIGVGIGKSIDLYIYQYQQSVILDKLAIWICEFMNRGTAMLSKLYILIKMFLWFKEYVDLNQNTGSPFTTAFSFSRDEKCVPDLPWIQ